MPQFPNAINPALLTSEADQQTYLDTCDPFCPVTGKPVTPELVEVYPGGFNPKTGDPNGNTALEAKSDQPNGNTCPSTHLWKINGTTEHTGIPRTGQPV